MMQKSKDDLLNIVNVISEEVKAHGDRIALRQGDKKITYHELFEKVKQTTEVLKKIPFASYARVGLLLDEGIDYIILNLAVMALPAVVIPIPQASSFREMQEIVDEMKLDTLIFEKDLFQSASRPCEIHSPFSQKVLNVTLFDSRMNEQAEFESINPAFIRFTSGTTGKSKGVVISHESILDRTDAAQQMLKITHEDIILWVLPMTYHFVVTTLLFLRKAATIILSDHDIPKGLIEGARFKDATFIYAAPMHYQAMVHSKELKPDFFSEVRMAVSTTMPLDSQVASQFQEKFGFELSVAYGIIEIGLPFMNDSRLPDKRPSVGTLVAGYQCCLKDRDAEGVGIVGIKGPGMFDAYFSPWVKREKLLDDGWFMTGDLGRLDEQGFLYLLGRNQQMIHFMGMKILPSEVEAVLSEYRGIREAFVYGEPHEVFGQIPQAKIVLLADCKDLQEDELRRFCYQRLSSYKVPKKFEVVDCLKRTLSGKRLIKQ